MYHFNEQIAKQADHRLLRLTEPGEYIGQFTQAEAITSQTGSQGIACVFETSDQQVAYFTLWTHKEGQALFGYRQLNTLMRCLELRHLTPVAGTVVKWDSAHQARLEIPAQGFPELLKKPIGILFDTESYLKQNGQRGIKAVSDHSFQAHTGLTASERLDGKVQPQKKEQYKRYLKHWPLRESSAASVSNPAPAYPNDDLPF